MHSFSVFTKLQTNFWHRTVHSVVPILGRAGRSGRAADPRDTEPDSASQGSKSLLLPDDFGENSPFHIVMHEKCNTGTEVIQYLDFKKLYTLHIYILSLSIIFLSFVTSPDMCLYWEPCGQDWLGMGNPRNDTISAFSAPPPTWYALFFPTDLSLTSACDTFASSACMNKSSCTVRNLGLLIKWKKKLFGINIFFLTICMTALELHTFVGDFPLCIVDIWKHRDMDGDKELCLKMGEKGLKSRSLGREGGGYDGCSFQLTKPFLVWLQDIFIVFLHLWWWISNDYLSVPWPWVLLACPASTDFCCQSSTWSDTSPMTKSVQSCLCR